MKKKLLVLLFIFSIFLTSCSAKKNVDPIDDNYRVFYEIFVGSFSDSNNDGIGDLKGITKRLDYLNDGNIDSGKSLGIQGIWLTPIFASPSYHKYDAIDYYTIDPQFGNMSDLEKLIKECHKRNIIVILDLVLNHTSNECEWFKEFVNAHQRGDTANKYYNYYSYANNSSLPPNKAYASIQGTDQSYECNFYDGMPELNYDNEEVRQEALNIAKFYLDKGIDGFRFDAAKYIYFNDTYSSVSFWKWYTDELRKIKEDVYLVSEVWSSDSEVNEYIRAMNCFNFTMAQAEGIIAQAAKGNNLNSYTNYIEKYQETIKGINKDAMAIPFISNHDMDRAAGYLNVFNSQAYIGANLYLLSPGSPFIYYGEEIGMKGTRGGSNTDANRRLAMLWGDGDTVQDPEGATFSADKQVNGTVKEQLNSEYSLLNYYSKVIAFRNRYPQIARGAYKRFNLNQNNLGGFVITYNGESTYLLHNNSKDTISIKADMFKEMIDYVGLNEAKFENGQLTVGAYTSILLK
ncbi:MAG: hypothetical protein IK151_04140 [Erysipelotrichaceae bacterium]|nr:hypothetical protein [Erysipelotrichaceae bacterium]